MPNLSQLSAITTAATALTNLILVTPQAVVGYQPQNPNNPDGTPSTAAQPPSFLFNYEGEQTAQLESDITDHYVEQNFAVQDQIALRPEIVNTEGYIGELNDVTPRVLAPLKTLADKLTTVGSYVPTISETALIAYNEAFFAYQIAANAANAAISAWSTLGNLFSGSNGQSVIGSNGLTTASSQNKQQTAFQQFYGWWASRTLFTVQTPWAVFQNMAIKSLTATQDAETNTVTSFKVSFKMIRIASTISDNGVNISALPTQFQGRAQTQSSGPTDLGTSSPVQSESLDTGLSGMGVA